MNAKDGSRRDFLKGTAAVAGAALAANLIAPKAHAGGADLIRVGLIGCGGRGSGAAFQTLSVPGSNVKLVAMADALEDRLNGGYDNIKGEIAKLKAKPAEKGGVDITEKLDVAPDKKFTGLDAYKKVLENCDMVILATPPGFRPQHFEAAIAAGKNVFMEKPVCVDSWGARLVAETAKKADEKNLKVTVGLQRRYQNNYLAAFAKVQEGVIGDIISAQVYWNGEDIWFKKRDAAQKLYGDVSEMKYQVYNWYHFAWLCGDHICEQHVHNLDVANWFIGAHPVSAAGMGGRTVKERNSEIFDSHYVEYRYPNGVIVNSQCRQIPNTKTEVREEFHGTKGVLRISGGNDAVATDYKGNLIWKYEGKDNPNPYQVEHNVLHSMIRENKPHNDAYYGLSSTFTAVLGRYATYTGKEHFYDKAMALDYRLSPEVVTFDTPPPTKPDSAGKYAVPVPGQFKIG